MRDNLAKGTALMMHVGLSRALVLLLVMCGAACTANTPAELERRASQIVSGEEEQGYPGVGALVALFPEDTYTGSFCSGTLIAPRWVLTAAHCIDGFRGQAFGRGYEPDDQQLHLFVGTHADDRESGVLLQGRQITVHPDYNREADTHYDIALIELAEPAPDDVRPISIHRGGLEGREDAPVFYVGFGTSDPDGGESGIKRSVTRTLASVQPVTYLTSQDEGGVCFGDSGGPGLLDVDGAWEVIGVNSSVVGEPTCRNLSAQVRVDAYQTWIDAVMGNEPRDCNTDEAICQCAEACREDGVCDNAQCGQPSCQSILSCTTFCAGPGCTIRCLFNATPTANFLFFRLVDCINERCPPGESDCASGYCSRELLGCQEGLESVTGTAQCDDLYGCVEGCTDDDCIDSCYFSGTLEAQAQFDPLETCGAERCRDVAFSSEYERCLAERCRDDLLTCMPSDACRLSGDEGCPEGFACIPGAWGATYCLPSLERPVGDACERTDDGNVACEDGALCVDTGDGSICRQMCTVAADCMGDHAPLCVRTRGEGAPFPIGLCTLPCSDRDGDGACDEEDCAPDDASAYPGGNEVCGSTVDEDCDGEVDEGCLEPEPEEMPAEMEPAPEPEVNDPETVAEPAMSGGSGGCQVASSPTQQPLGWWLLMLAVVCLCAKRGVRVRGLMALVVVCGAMAGCSDEHTDLEVFDGGGSVDAAADSAELFDMADSEGSPDTTFMLDTSAPDMVPAELPPTIQQVQQGVIAVGETVELETVWVTSPVGGGFFVSDGTSNAHSGVWVELSEEGPAPELEIGDEIALTAVVFERAWDEENPNDATTTRTELRLTDNADIQIVERGAMLPEPLLLSVGELAIVDIAELYEGVVVMLDGSGELAVTEQFADEGMLLLNGVVVLDDLFVEFDLSWVEVGSRYMSVRGPLHFEDGRYTLVPRGPEDLVVQPVSSEGCLPLGQYTLCTEQTTWQSARVSCARQGGRLVVLETEEENLAVGALVRPWMDAAFWIGLSDRETEDEWLWIDGRPLTYDPWGENEPNDWGSGEDCVHSNWRGDGVWNDNRCNSREPYVCEFRDEAPRCDDDSACGEGSCMEGRCVAPEP